MKVFLIILLLSVAVSVASQGIQKTKPKPILSPRIANGVTAKMGQLKYQVGLRIKKGDHLVSTCTGALIARSWILTKASCLDGASRVYAYLESTTFQSGRLVPVYQWIIHDEFDEQTLSNDISLLRIRTLNSKLNVAPVALPPLDGSDINYVNETFIASGWGYTNDEDIKLASELQYARLKVVPNTVCSRFYGTVAFKDTNICVQGPRGASTCKGDGGAPLVAESTGVLVGINSYNAAAGCTRGLPIAFTRVSSYRSWINDVSGV